MRKFKLSRRSLLKGVVGGTIVSVALPPLEAFFNSTGTALASGSPIPKRFGMFFWGNGVIPERWVPTGVGKDYQLSEQLAPLAAVKDSITVVSGLHVKVPNFEPHWSGAAGILSGAPLKREGQHGTLQAPSIDQVIAQRLNAPTPYRSIEFGARPGQGVSYNGPHSINPPESSPRALFNRLFGEGFRLPGDTSGPDPILGVRRSVLDAVMEDAKALQQRLGATDRQRLDQHLSGLRDLERRVAYMEENPPDFESCAVPTEPDEHYPDIEGRPQLTELNRVLTDICAMAVACDLTRVFSNQFTYPITNLLFQGATAGHHQLTHDEPGDQPEVHSIVLQIMAELRYFIEKLRSVPEGDGTLLDNSLVFATTDCSFGRTHSIDEFPVVLAGTAGGQLRTGEHVRVVGENASKLLLEMINSVVEVPLGEFGQEEGWVDEGLSAIRV